MPNALSVADVCKVQIYTFDTTQIGINTFWYKVLAVGAIPSTDQDVATTFDAAVSTQMLRILNNNAEYRGIRVQIYLALTATPTFVDVISVAGAGAGTGGATSLAKQVAGITSWYTNQPRQAFRGRSYWPFPAAEHDTGDGFPDAAYVVQINDLSNQIKNYSNPSTGGRIATVQQVLFNRKTKGFTPIASYLARPLWATQRRRGSYGRPQGAPPF